MWQIASLNGLSSLVLTFVLQRTDNESLLFPLSCMSVNRWSIVRLWTSALSLLDLPLTFTFMFFLCFFLVLLSQKITSILRSGQWTPLNMSDPFSLWESRDHHVAFKTFFLTTFLLLLSNITQCLYGMKALVLCVQPYYIQLPKGELRDRQINWHTTSHKLIGQHGNAPVDFFLNT